MCKKKKILFINGHLNVGGVEKSLVDILQHIDYNRYDVDLLLLEGMGDYENELPPQVNINLKRLDGTYGPFIPCLLGCISKHDWFSLKMRLIFFAMKLRGQKCIKYAQSILTQNKSYDCVIGFRSGICSQIAAYAVNGKKKLLWWHHGEFNVDAAEYADVVNACDAVVSVSDSCASMLAEEIPAIEKKLVVISNMVDVASLMRKAKRELPYKQSESVKQIVTVCRISPEKHIENVFYVARQLKEKGINFCWHIVGDGVNISEMKQSAYIHEVEDCVVFEGRKINPYPYMLQADLYVHPSYVESQGLTVLEAMSLGVPCVVTKSRGPSEFVEHGNNGYMVEQSPDALAEGVRRILRDEALYSKVKAGSKCPEKFLPDVVMRRIDDLLCN